MELDFARRSFEGFLNVERLLIEQLLRIVLLELLRLMAITFDLFLLFILLFLFLVVELLLFQVLDLLLRQHMSELALLPDAHGGDVAAPVRQHTSAVLLAVEPLARVDAAIGPLESSLALFDIIDEFTLVLAAVGPS